MIRPQLVLHFVDVVPNLSALQYALTKLGGDIGSA